MVEEDAKAWATADVRQYIIEYAAAKQDFDDKRLNEDTFAWRERLRRLEKAENQLKVLAEQWKDR